MSYQQAWQFLDDLQFFKIKLGLDSMTRFLDQLGNPHQQLSCIHIGGTNGKGSVGATLCSILDMAGYQTGLYTSPHLNSVRERFRINTRYISPDDFSRLISKIIEVLDGQQITYFECTTALALLWFAEQKVDVALLEVGMGGRLDATNVITPRVSIITNVSMDHELYLGDTVAKVAAEKAGIIKHNVPVVSGVTDEEPARVINDTCTQCSAPLYLLGRDFNGQPVSTQTGQWQYRGIHDQLIADLPMAMRGSYQIGNASLALAAIELLHEQKYSISQEQIRLGLSQTRWPGRLEYFRIDRQGKVTHQVKDSLEYLLDGAHNPAGVTALQHALTDDFNYSRLILIWGAMSDKDLQTTLEEISPLADFIILTQPASERSATAARLLDALPASLHHKAICTATVADAVNQARKYTLPDDLICIAGSLYLVGEARQLLRGDLIADG